MESLDEVCNMIYNIARDSPLSKNPIIAPAYSYIFTWFFFAWLLLIR